MREKVSGQAPQLNKKENPISRRDFFKTTAAAVLAAEAALGSKESEARVSREIKTWADVAIFESKYQKVDYTKEPKEITPEIESLLLDISQFQKELTKIIGLSQQKIDANIVKEIEEEKTDKGERIEALKKDFWDKLKKYFPELHSYSPENYCRVLVNDIPRYLAPYRIFAKPMFCPSADLANDYFSSAEAILALFKISDVTSEEVQQWDKKLQRDTVYIQGHLKIKNQALTPYIPCHTSGQTFYQNVLIYEPALLSEHSAHNDSDSELIRQLDSIGEEQIRSFVESENNPQRQKEGAIAFAFAKIMKEIENTQATKTELEENTIAHETGHLGDTLDEKFMETIKPRIFDRPKEFFTYNQNLFVHEEINGLLSELRHCPRKDVTMVNLLATLDEETWQDFGHDRAGSWILEKMIEIISKESSSYGIKIKSASRISPINQIIMHLPDLLDKPNLLDKMSEEIRKIHFQNLDEDFSKDYFRTSKLPFKKTLNFPLKTVGKFAGPALALGGAALLFKKISRRKSIGEAEQIIRTSFGKKKGTAENLIGRLQLGVKKNEVNEQKRQAALRTLTKKSKNDPELQRALRKLKNI